MKVYVLIVNWNGWKDTIECLESVFRLDYPEYRVIVCDNGSNDESLDKIKSWADGNQNVISSTPLHHPASFPPIVKPIQYVVYDRLTAETGGDINDNSIPLVLINNAENLGFAGGNNVGLRYVLARGDAEYIWLLNNDTVVDSHALSELVNRMKDKPDAGMCGSTIYYYEHPDRIQAAGGGWYCKWIGLPWHYGRFSKISELSITKVESWMNYVEGASMLISKSFLKEIGLMCEDYFLYFEETDWALRAQGKYSLAYAQDSIVYHKVGKSIGTSSDPRKKSMMCDYYSIRNRLFFTQKFFPYALPVIYLSLVVALVVRLLLGQLERVHMIYSLIKCSKSGAHRLSLHRFVK